MINSMCTWCILPSVFWHWHLGNRKGKHMACKSLFLLSPVVGSLSGDQAQPEITMEKEIRYSETESSTGGVSSSTTLVVLPFFQDHPGEPVPEEDFWTDFIVQGKINRDSHIDHPAGCHSIRTNECPPPPSPIFLQAGCPFCHPTNSIKALKATSAFGSGRRC